MTQLVFVEEIYKFMNLLKYVLAFPASFPDKKMIMLMSIVF